MKPSGITNSSPLYRSFFIASQTLLCPGTMPSCAGHLIAIKHVKVQVEISSIFNSCSSTAKHAGINRVRSINGHPTTATIIHELKITDKKYQETYGDLYDRLENQSLLGRMTKNAEEIKLDPRHIDPTTEHTASHSVSSSVVKRPELLLQMRRSYRANYGRRASMLFAKLNLSNSLTRRAKHKQLVKCTRPTRPVRSAPPYAPTRPISLRPLCYIR